MADTDVIFIGLSDLSGQVRGKGVLRRDFDAGRYRVGWTPTNAFITCFGGIAPSPYGALGDAELWADLQTLVMIEEPEWGLTERFVLGGVTEIETSAPWALCPRSQLAAALERLDREHGLQLTVAFEHEFHLTGVDGHPGFGYMLEAFRRYGAFSDRYTNVLERAGLTVENFLPEYGCQQAEICISPKPALRGADEAVILRELTRATARTLGLKASFAPIIDPASVGNGVHVHFSLSDRNGTPVNYDASEPHGLSETAGAFLAGIQRHLPEAIALTASAVTSYARLTPHRWSAAFNNLGLQDREAALRICPVFRGADPERAYHFEFRGADGAASPHLLLAALVHAGRAGVADALASPAPTAQDLSELGKKALAAKGLVRLPRALPAALEKLKSSAWARDAFGDTLVDGFCAHKTTEVEATTDWDMPTACSRYAEVY